MSERPGPGRERSRVRRLVFNDLRRSVEQQMLAAEELAAAAEALLESGGEEARERLRAALDRFRGITRLGY